MTKAILLTVSIALSVLLSQAPCRSASDTDYGIRYGVDTLATELAANLPEDKPLRLAVMDFTDLQGYTDVLGKYAADRLSIRLSQYPAKIQVVTRQRLEEILKEHKISRSGLFDQATTKRIGKLLGADALVLGTVIPMGFMLELTAEVVSIETGIVSPGATAWARYDSSLRQLQTQKRLPAVKEPPDANMVYVANKGRYKLRLLDLSDGKTPVLMATVNSTRIQPVKFKRNSLFKAEIYDDRGRLLWETLPERFNEGTWTWILDDFAAKRTSGKKALAPLLKKK
jgi:TolB-like protein